MNFTTSHVLITGANGFVGKHLVTAFEASGHKVSQFSRSSLPVEHLENNKYVVDLNDYNVVADSITALQPDFVVHLASEKTRVHNVSQFRDIYLANLTPSLNVISACRLLPNFRKLIYLGTCDEYGQVPTPYCESQKEVPTNAYGLSKLAITQVLLGLFHSHQFPSVILRPSVIYGPHQGNEMFLSALIQSLLAGQDFPMTSGEQLRDFIYVDDVVQAILLAVCSDAQASGNVINIGSGNSYLLKSIAALVADCVDPNAIRHIRFGDIRYRSNEVMNYSIDITRAKEVLNWTPSISLNDGLLRTVKHFMQPPEGKLQRDRDCA